ncbi:uncharacterized protein METZ01_LOCUS415896, partial [marine metagenome]
MVFFPSLLFSFSIISFFLKTSSCRQDEFSTFTVSVPCSIFSGLVFSAMFSPTTS